MNTNKKALLAVAMVALMLAVPFTIMGGSEDSSATSTVPTGNSYIYTLNTSTWAATKDGSEATALTGWNFDTDTGLGPFNSFYAAINTPSSVANADANRLSDTIGKIAYILNPNDLTQGKVGNSWTAILNIDTYNIMWVVPTVYWKVSGTTLTMSNDPANGGQAYAHTFSGVTYPYIAIGVYEATVHSDGLGSRTGVSPAASRTIDQFRDLASLSNQTTDFGTYILWDFNIWTMYKAMAMTVAGSNDSQDAVNYGNAKTGSGASKTGLGNSVGYYGGNGSSTSTSTVNTYSKLFIENSWGSVNDFVDNAYIDTSYIIHFGHSLSNEQNILTPTITGTEGTVTIDPSDLTKPSQWSYGLDYSSAATFGFHKGTLSETEDVDAIYVSKTAGNHVVFVGGDWNNTSYAGLSCAAVSDALSISNNRIGARLAYVMSADVADAEPTNTITYRAMDGSAIAGINPTTAREGVAHTLPAAPAAPTGYTDFLGWYTAPAYGAKIGVAGASYTPASNMDLYAVFTPYSAYTQTIVYNEWNGSAYAATQTGVVSGGSYLAMPAPFSTVKTVGNVDYKFMGWAAKDAAPTEISTDAAQQKVGTLYTYTPAANAELSITSQFYAVYQATYTVTFTNETDSITVSGIAGEKVQAPNMFSSETGKLLQGYYTDSTSKAIVATYGTWIEIPDNNTTTYTAVFMDVGSGGSSDITMYDVATDIIWVDDQGQTITTAPFDVTFSKKIASGSYGLVSVKKNASYAAGQSVVLTLLKNDDSGEAANANITQIDGSFWMISSVLENVKIKATVSTSTETGMSAFYVSGTADKNNQVRVVLESESDAGLAAGSVTLGGTYKTVNGQGQSKYGAITEALIDTVDGQTGQKKTVAGGESKISSVFGLKDSKQAYYVYATYTVDESSVCSMAVLTPALYEDDN